MQREGKIRRLALTNFDTERLGVIADQGLRIVSNQVHYSLIDRRPAGPPSRSSAYASDAELGEVPHIRTPIKIGEGVQVRTVAPKLGQHNDEILGQLGVTEAEMRELRTRRVL